MFNHKTDLKKPRNCQIVKDQYEDYPYPNRNPEDEYTRLLVVVGAYLGEINHWLFKGKEDFKSKFRILIAGGGTGDALIYLAHQLRNTDAEIVYLDFSQASRTIAQKRAEIRQLKNIIWITDDLLNIPNLKLGKFDFIDCSGVLHHLKSPSEGLSALKSVLSERGGMNIMVYARYGRTGIYHVQRLMRKINAGVMDKGDEIKNTKLILDILPNSNWFKFGDHLFSDISNYGDTGLYDLLLHKRDHCYDVNEIHDLVNQENLNFVEFSIATTRVHLKPEFYIKDFSLLQKIKSLDTKEQQAICELIRGDITKHTFYISNNKDTVANLSDLNNVPHFYSVSSRSGVEIANLIISNNLSSSKILQVSLDNHWFKNLIVNIKIGNLTETILRNVDGNKSLGDIFDTTQRKYPDLNISLEFFLHEVKSCLTTFIEAGTLLLRDQSNTFL